MIRHKKMKKEMACKTCLKVFTYKRKTRQYCSNQCSLISWAIEMRRKMKASK